MNINQKIELVSQDDTELEVEITGSDSGVVMLEIRIDDSDSFRVDLTDRTNLARVRALGSILDTARDLGGIERINRKEREFEES